MRRIFLVGCPRSGTTLVQSLLAAGSELTSFTESHFFDRALAHPPFDRRRVRDAGHRLRAFAGENGLGDVLGALAAGADAGPAEAAAAFTALLDGAAADRGRVGWVEKTPDHLFRISAITRLVPGAEFVHVVRRPEATVRSLVRASRDWGKPRSAFAFGVKWLLCARLTGRYRGRPRHHVVFYDDLVAGPEAGTRSLYAALGLAWSPDIMSRYRDVARDLVVSGETWKAKNFEEIGRRPETKDEGGVYRLLSPWLRRRYEALHGARG
jgi:hypothetical protein